VFYKVAPIFVYIKFLLSPTIDVAMFRLSSSAYLLKEFDDQVDIQKFLYHSCLGAGGFRGRQYKVATGTIVSFHVVSVSEIGCWHKTCKAN
jgi:hypothetical protein